MKKALGSWSGMRKYLEKEMLAESLKGRVRYNCTRYVGMDDCHIFEVYANGVLMKQFSWETVNSYFIDRGLTSQKEPYGIREYWKDFWTLLENTPKSDRTEYTDGEFSEALAEYRGQSIEESLKSDDPIVRMFAILDRRVGKRTLIKLKEADEPRPEWLRAFCTLRFEAENLISPEKKA